MEKKAQMEFTFHWIYIAIAGAIILLFFTGIVVRQSRVSEEKLSSEVTRIMESILTGAGVSEKTKNIIDASGLVRYILYFDCDAGVSEFGIVGKPSRSQNAIDPIFAPKELWGTKIITWSLPYQFPFKVTDFLFVSSSNIQYYIVGDDPVFINEFLNATEAFNRRFVLELNEIDASGNIQVRIIDVGGMHVPAVGIPNSLRSFKDKDVTAVVFGSARREADFYVKDDTSWKKLNSEPVRIVSLGGERDAAKYAAIFSGDDKTYRCNMGKAFRRLELVTEAYGGTDIGSFEAGGKLKEMGDFYTVNEGFYHPNCLGNVKTYPDHNLIKALGEFNNRAVSCRLELAAGSSLSFCVDLITVADELKTLNDNLRLNCITLY